MFSFREYVTGRWHGSTYSRARPTFAEPSRGSIDLRASAHAAATWASKEVSGSFTACSTFRQKRMGCEVIRGREEGRAAIMVAVGCESVELCEAGKRDMVAMTRLNLSRRLF